MILRRLYYSLPVHWRFRVRKLVYLPLDILRKPDYVNGIQVPPRSLIFTGSGNFIQAGEKFLLLFIELTGLQKDHQILDIGSGMGRIAIPLTKYINEKGKYYGVDVVPHAIEWCQNNISSKYPNFQFDLIGVHNDLYTADGTDASQLKLEIETGTFNLVCLISVFTHMEDKELENYLEEIYRILKPGGHCFASFFLFDDKTELSDNNFVKFRFLKNHFALMSKRVRSANVAYSRKWLFQMIADKGFSIEYYNKGSWRKNALQAKDFQDIVILKKLK